MPLTPAQQERYRRNIDVVGLGTEGQLRLLGSSVLVVGASGLGSAALPYLAAAGVGRIGIVDGDHVELKNMQRQVLHTELGRNKAESAAERSRAWTARPRSSARGSPPRVAAVRGTGPVELVVGDGGRPTSGRPTAR